SVPGGRHPGHGTANRIIPLGDNYLELVSVVDPEEAAASGFGSWVAAGRERFPTLDALCLRSDDLGSVCDRLGLEPFAMGRKRPDGIELHWRLAGLEKALAEGLPFFMQWDVPPQLLPGRTPVSHPSGSVRISEVVVSGDVERLAAWVGDASGLTLVEGPLRIVGVTIEGSGSELKLTGAGS
ncbi:MAG: VOC family protein, partial [Acidimicrobiia bacterium]